MIKYDNISIYLPTMSFFSETTVNNSLVTRIWLLIICIKASTVTSCHCYDDSKYEKRAFKVYKLRRINKTENEERQDLPVNYKNNRYISFSLLKISNRPVNLGERMRSLIYLVSIKSNRYRGKY